MFIQQVHNPRTGNGFENRFEIVILPMEDWNVLSCIHFQLYDTQIQENSTKFVEKRDLRRFCQSCGHRFESLGSKKRIPFEKRTRGIRQDVHVLPNLGALCSKSELCVLAQPTSDPISQDVRDTLRASFPSVEIFFFGSLQCVIWYTEAGHCDNKVQLYPTDFESNRGGRIYQWWCPRMGVAWQAPWVLSCWHCTPNSSADVAGILKLANKHNVSVCYDFDNRRPSQILFWGLGWIKLDWLMLLLFYYFIRK